MRQINPTDTLFVHVMCLGTTLLNKEITGASGYGDVVRSVAGMLDCGGMMRMNVRNRTQGWVEVRSVWFRH